MKHSLPTSSTAPAKAIKPDSFKRLSLAVKKLDQLINRAHQLGSFTDQLLREDKTGPSFSSSETDPHQPVSPSSLTRLDTSRKVEGKNQEEL
ncbi:MAG: hypothetical protein WD425_12205 [Nitrospirales bacterium]